MPNNKSQTATPAQAEFIRKGWSYRSAATHLGVNHGHLLRVLSGERQSRRLLRAIHALPKRIPANPSGPRS